MENTEEFLRSGASDRGGGSRQWQLYLLELENNNLYVGITRNVIQRFEQHRSGTGSQWTSRHKPLRILRYVDTGLTSESEAARIEDALTVQIMELFGRHCVRGGQYCMLDQADVDAALVRQGHWLGSPQLRSAGQLGQRSRTCCRDGPEVLRVTRRRYSRRLVLSLVHANAISVLASRFRRGPGQRILGSRRYFARTAQFSR
jgi:predicted GIY-YIG superfamily endonuclease